MPVQDQTAGGMEISWEVRNRFRLFREERDFQIHVATEGNRSTSRRRTGAGAAKRRPRLGPQHREPPLHRPRRPRQRALHPRQRPGKLSDADGAFRHRSPDRRGPGRRRLRLVVRRRRWCPRPDAGLRRADRFPRPLRPRHHRHRRCVERSRRAAAPRHPDQGARHPDRRVRRFHRLG